jgi:hypothetical protein
MYRISYHFPAHDNGQLVPFFLFFFWMLMLMQPETLMLSIRLSLASIYWLGGLSSRCILLAWEEEEGNLRGRGVGLSAYVLGCGYLSRCPAFLLSWSEWLFGFSPGREDLGPRHLTDICCLVHMYKLCYRWEWPIVVRCYCRLGDRELDI